MTAGASTGAGGLSRLAAKGLKAGGRREGIAPGKREQNGRHERLPLTLLQDTARPPARSLRQQLERLRAFQRSYNEERPHQGRWCFGKAPMQTFLDSLPIAKEKMLAAHAA